MHDSVNTFCWYMLSLRTQNKIFDRSSRRQLLKLTHHPACVMQSTDTYTRSAPFDMLSVSPSSQQLDELLLKRYDQFAENCNDQ